MRISRTVSSYLSREFLYLTGSYLILAFLYRFFSYDFIKFHTKYDILTIDFLEIIQIRVYLYMFFLLAGAVLSEKGMGYKKTALAGAGLMMTGIVLYFLVPDNALKILGIMAAGFGLFYAGFIGLYVSYIRRFAEKTVMYFVLFLILPDIAKILQLSLEKILFALKTDTALAIILLLINAGAVFFIYSLSGETSSPRQNIFSFRKILLYILPFIFIPLFTVLYQEWSLLKQLRKMKEFQEPVYLSDMDYALLGISAGVLVVMFLRFFRKNKTAVLLGIIIPVFLSFLIMAVPDYNNFTVRLKDFLFSSAYILAVSTLYALLMRELPPGWYARFFVMIIAIEETVSTVLHIITAIIYAHFNIKEINFQLNYWDAGLSLVLYGIYIPYVLYGLYLYGKRGSRKNLSINK